MKTLRKISERIMLSVIVAALFALLPVVPASAIPMGSLNLLSSSIAVGDSFDVEVWIDGDGIGEELLAFGFDVVLADGSYFSYNSYVLNPAFNDESLGMNNVAGSAFPGVTDDDVLLATLSFTALAEGADTLDLLGPYDGMFSGLYYELNGYDLFASLDIRVGDPVPEPTSMILLGTGLAGLAGCRRRSKK